MKTISEYKQYMKRNYDGEVPFRRWWLEHIDELKQSGSLIVIDMIVYVRDAWDGT